MLVFSTTMSRSVCRLQALLDPGIWLADSDPKHAVPGQTDAKIFVSRSVCGIFGPSIPRVAIFVTVTHIYTSAPGFFILFPHSTGVSRQHRTCSLLTHHVCLKPSFLLVLYKQLSGFQLNTLRSLRRLYTPTFTMGAQRKKSKCPAAC